jgi:hypothetical protein
LFCSSENDGEEEEKGEKCVPIFSGKAEFVLLFCCIIVFGRGNGMKVEKENRITSSGINYSNNNGICLSE